MPASPSWKVSSSRSPSSGHRRDDFSLAFTYLLTASTFALPELETLQKRLSKVEGQLDERTTTVGALTQERDRLLLVEGELNGTLQRQAGKLSTLQREHRAELEQLVATHTTVEEGLQKERDEAVSKLEATANSHQRALLAAQGQADSALDALREMDDMIGGKQLLPLSHPAAHSQPALCL